MGNAILRIALFILVGGIFFFSATSRAAENIEPYINIPQQNAEDAVKALSRVHKKSLLFQTDDIAAVNSNTLKGEYSLAEALDDMFQGTSLHGSLTEGGVIVISRRETKHASGGQPTMRKSNFFLTTALAAVATTVVSTAQAQEGSDVNADTNDTIVVTGSRALNRTALETAVPVDVFSVEELTSTGRVELNQILASTVPSFNFNQTAINDGTDIIRPATLRGLAPDQTLVLVNTKRRHSAALVNINGSVGRGSAAVDLNSIPTSAIGSVEVLRDGASAQYGSDAIAGVINILLREADSGGALNIRYGGHVTDPETLGRSIVDGGTLTIGGWAGFNLADSGFATISFEYSDRSATNRAGLDPRQQYATDVNGDLLPDGVLDPREQTFDRLNHRYGNGNAENLSFFVNSGYDLSEDWEFYLSGGYQDRQGDASGFYRRSGDATTDFRSTPRNLLEIYPDGFLPLIVGDVTDYSFSSGFRGDLAGWGTDLSVTYGSNELDYSVINTLNASLGPSSPTEFDAGALEFNQLTVNLDFTKSFETILPGVVVISAGGEFRNEGFIITAGEPDSYAAGTYAGIEGQNYPVGDDPISFASGSQVFAGFTPQSAVDVDRQSFGFYLDTEWEPMEQLLLSGAVRFEDYSDFGSEVTYKFSGRYDFIEQVALRGAISSGFRAPSLQQQFFTATSTNFIDGDPFEVGTFPATSDPAVALGGGQLDAETSNSYSVGLVLRPTADWFLTVDAYQIDIDNQIFLSENLSGSDVDMVLADAGVVGVDLVRFFQNGIETRTRGIDVVTRYSLDLGEGGELGLSGAFNWNEVDVQFVPENEAIPSLTLFSRDRILTMQEGAPNTKIVAGADWVYKQATVNLRGTRYGEVIDPSNNPDNDFAIGPDWILDLSVDVNVTENVSVGFGADNILDQYPRATPSNQSFNGIFPYSSRSPYGFSGRFIYGRASISW